MNNREFNPHSGNALFATIIARLENQDKVLEDIKTQTTKTNGRVTHLERVIAYGSGFFAAIMFLIEVYHYYVTK